MKFKFCKVDTKNVELFSGGAILKSGKNDGDDLIFQTFITEESIEKHIDNIVKSILYNGEAIFPRKSGNRTIPVLFEGYLHKYNKYPDANILVYTIGEVISIMQSYNGKVKYISTLAWRRLSKNK